MRSARQEEIGYSNTISKWPSCGASRGVKMAREIIGSCGSAGTLEKGSWPLVHFEIAIIYLKHVCGEPPLGCELEVVLEDVIQERLDCASPSGFTVVYDSTDLIGVTWESDDCIRRYDDAPPDYINQCQIALRAFDAAVDWCSISPKIVRAGFGEPEEDEDSDADED
jgi:hypothetical protein